jgi:hypothetical protein
MFVPSSSVLTSWAYANATGGSNIILYKILREMQVIHVFTIYIYSLRVCIQYTVDVKLERGSLQMYVRFEFFTAVPMKNAVFWDVALCRSCVNRRFGGTYRLHL